MLGKLPLAPEGGGAKTGTVVEAGEDPTEAACLFEKRAKPKVTKKNKFYWCRFAKCPYEFPLLYSAVPITLELGFLL